MKRRRKWFVGALVALLGLLLPLAALGEEWRADREIHCADHLPGCRLLQMVMMGSFDDDTPRDAVSQRVLASAWPRLREVTEADIDHFVLEFGEEGERVRLRWYAAMANCLRAELQAEIRPEAAGQVLLLFLDPSVTPNAGAQQVQIREELTEEIIDRLAEALDAPAAFIRWAMTAYEPGTTG